MTPPPAEPAVPVHTGATLRLEGVGKHFSTTRGDVVALDDINLSVNEGEFVVLVGPSGCGKSTILNLIAGLDIPSRGALSLKGRPVKGPGRDRMVMFQETGLFPWLDVKANVLFGLKLNPGLSDAEREKTADHYLELVGLTKFKHAHLHELSGGMRQRVALARCLAPNPEILLMDEPFSALDALTREQLYGDIQRIFTQRSRTIVFVTHNIRESVCLGDRVVLLSPHPGRINEIFEIDLPRPRDINDPALAQYTRRITAALKANLEATSAGEGHQE